MARVNYTGVPTETPTGPPPQELNVRATPEAFGAQVGEATQKLGGTLEKAGQETLDTAVKFKQMQNETDALNLTSKLSADVSNEEATLYQKRGNDASAYLPTFQQNLQAIYQKYATATDNPMVRLAVERDARSLISNSQRNAGIHVGQQAQSANIEALKAGITTESAKAVRYTHPEDLESGAVDFTPLHNRVISYAQAQGVSDKGAVDQMFADAVGKTVHDMVTARTAMGDYAGADKIAKWASGASVPGTNLPILNGDRQAEIARQQSFNASTQLTQQMRALALDTKLKTEAAEKAGNGYVTQMLKDPTQVDPQAIANDPHLKYEQKLSLTNALNAVLAGKGQGKDAQTYGTGFYQAYQAVHLPEGDPNRITDPFQLYGRVGPKPPPNFALTGAEGMKAPGNLDPWNRPSMQNPDGSYSTTSSISVGTDKGEVLIPTVVNGKRLSNDDAIAHFKQTGENFGTFDTPDHANAYATALHNAQATLYDAHGNRLMGDLTLAGVDKLTAEIAGRRTPEGEAEGEMKKTFLSNARAQITGTNEGLHLRDPKGDELYLKFLAQALPAIDAGKKAGKSAPQLLSPDSPDYVGKVIPTFKRPLSQWTSDMLQDNAPEPAGQGAIDLTTRDGIVAAYQGRKITRDQAGQALSAIGIKFDQGPAAPAAGPSAPLR